MGWFRNYIDNPKKAYWHSAAWFTSMIILVISLGEIPRNCMDHNGTFGDSIIIDSKCNSIWGTSYYSNNERIYSTDSDLAVYVIFPLLWIQVIISVILLFLAEKGRKEQKKASQKKEYRENKKMKANEREQARDYDNAIEIWEELGEIEEAARVRKEKANEREQARDYDNAIEIWEEMGQINEAARVRTLKAEQGAVKVDQTVVQGDQVTKTEIKDSVLNRSNVGAGSDDKVTKLEKIAEMKDKGIIDDDEFKQMKKEILGK